ncbi:MAG TPA: glucose 1-dehydrogenase [Thermoanaerobaculia bacterium]|nr:glucose 1-dehydrogenase [Thermoanaerobaculia bacterium]
MESGSLENEVAIVTGAAEGIGCAIAAALASDGAAVLLNDVVEAKAERAAEEIRAGGGRCEAAAGDVGSVEVARGLVDRAVESFGKVTLIAANAGVTLWSPFLDTDRAAFDRLLGINLGGSYFLAQAAARRMVEQRSGGAIVLTSSIAAHVGYPGLAAYSMTKAALESLARSLAVELAPHAIRVNAVAPGHTLVPRNLADDPDYESRWASLTPSGRIATPVDIANAVVFLLSSRSEQIRGQTLVIDGGWSIRGSMSER